MLFLFPRFPFPYFYCSLFLLFLILYCFFFTVPLHFLDLNALDLRDADLRYRKGLVGFRSSRRFLPISRGTAFVRQSAARFIEGIQLVHDGLQDTDDLVVVHALGTDDADRALHAFAQFVGGGDHAAVPHAGHWHLVADVDLYSFLSICSQGLLYDTSQGLFFLEIADDRQVRDT